MFHAVKRWPVLETVACPAERLWREISSCVLEQFAEDGGNKEQALHYHLFAFELALHACRAMKVTDGPVIERLQRGAAQGELAANSDPAVLGKFINTVMEGMSVQARDGATINELLSIAKMALDRWPAAI